MGERDHQTLNLGIESIESIQTFSYRSPLINLIGQRRSSLTILPRVQFQSIHLLPLNCPKYHLTKD